MAIWVREFMCRSCGKRHRVEGLRGKLEKLQKEREDDCEYQYRSQKMKQRIIEATKYLREKYGEDEVTIITVAIHLRQPIHLIKHYFPNDKALILAVNRDAT